MTHEEKIARWVLPLCAAERKRGVRDFGVEVGAFLTPIPGLRPLHVDKFASYSGQRVAADYHGDLTSLPFYSDSLDYVAASHVIEHVANPVQALWECARVLRPAGILYLVVPDRRSTFDHTRALTPAAHMLEDFERDVTDSDPTHLSDYLDGLDWNRWNPAASAAEQVQTREELRRIYTTELAAGLPINIHFHTFEPSSFAELLGLMNRHPKRPVRLEIVDQAEAFPEGRADGFLVVLRVHKPAAARLRAAARRLLCGGRVENALLPTARRLHDHASVVPESHTAHRDDTPISDSGPAQAAQPEKDAAQPTAPEPAVRGCIDLPLAGEKCDPLCFRIEGWVFGAAQNVSVSRVEAWVGAHKVGQTGLLFIRPDVIQAFGLEEAHATGYRITGHLPVPPPPKAPLTLKAVLSTGEVWDVAETEPEFLQRDYRANSFGILLRSDTIGIMRPEHMYTTGPSRADGSPEVVALLRQYLGPTPKRILDIGCGLGFYGKALREAGHDWFGVEMKPEDCAELAKQGLPHRQTDGSSLPFPDTSFDAALCVEVLEHIKEPRAFLAEARRVAPRQLLVSVPNAEIIPYLHDYLVTPRHMLDSDHTNFFTRWSLGSLLREFYPEVEVLMHTRHPLPTTEGTPLFYNLFAVARS